MNKTKTSPVRDKTSRTMAKGRSGGSKAEVEAALDAVVVELLELELQQQQEDDVHS
jgi:hypothetical protein